MSTDHDSWLEEPKVSRSVSAPALEVRIIENMEPLDEQFGVAEPLTVPEALYETLLAQSEPNKAEVVVYRIESEVVPALHTYAILDAAKVPNLPEMLDTSGLPHRCLFQGQAFDDPKDVAPWIVRLEEGNAFTRNLFTKGDAPWHLWGKEPGIYVRSRGILDEVWGHFRKFTRIQDENGKWFYFRFWEVAHLEAMLRGLDSKDQTKFFMNGKINSIHAIHHNPKPRAQNISLSVQQL